MNLLKECLQMRRKRVIIIFSMKKLKVTTVVKMNIGAPALAVVVPPAAAIAAAIVKLKMWIKFHLL